MRQINIDTIEKSNGRWWEFYFVRYLVGTVIGSAIIFNLNIQTGTALTNNIIPGFCNVSDLNTTLLAVLVGLGFAFCYLASAPILVFHATRGVWESQKISITKALALVFVLTISTLSYLYLDKSWDKVFGVVLVFTLIVFFQIILVYYSIAFKNSKVNVHEYYNRLTKKRSNKSCRSMQYIESYKHLREHGNSFFIVLFEFALGYFLLYASSFLAVPVLLILWIAPAASVWLVGTILEYRFSNDEA